MTRVRLIRALRPRAPHHSGPVYVIVCVSIHLHTHRSACTNPSSHPHTCQPATRASDRGSPDDAIISGFLSTSKSFTYVHFRNIFKCAVLQRYSNTDMYVKVYSVAVDKPVRDPL